MSLEMSRFVTFERGFGFTFIPQGNEVITKLIHPDYPELRIQVWNVTSARDEQKPGYIQTILSIYRLSVGIHIQSLIDHYRSVRRFGIDVIHPSEGIVRKIKQIKKRDLVLFLKKFNPITNEITRGTEVGQEPEIERLWEQIENNLEDNFLNSAGEACYQNDFERFIEKHLPLLPLERYRNWKSHLSWIMNGEDDRDKVFDILTFLYKRVPKWIKACQIPNEKDRIYIRERKGIPCSFECRRDGTLLMQYTYRPPESDQMQCLEINLDTGEIVQWIGLQKHIGDKILEFYPFEDREGLIQYLECYDRNEFLTIAKFEMTDTNLWDYFLKRQTLLTRIARVRWRMLTHEVLKKRPLHNKKIDFEKKIVELKFELEKFEFTDRQKEEIAFQLLNGIFILQKEGYVHFGIFPPAIVFRLTANNEIKAKISNYEYLFSSEDLPKRDIITYKWQTYFPKIQPIFQKEIKSPDAIPIFQLGCCFRLLYGDYPSDGIRAIIDGMTHPDPRQRLPIRPALTQLKLNPFCEEGEEAPKKSRSKEFELRSVTSFRVPPLAESFVEGDERKK